MTAPANQAAASVSKISTAVKSINIQPLQSLSSSISQLASGPAPKLVSSINASTAAIKNVDLAMIDFRSKIPALGTELGNLTGAYSRVQKGNDLVSSSMRSMLGAVSTTVPAIQASAEAVKNIGLSLGVAGPKMTAFASAYGQFTSAVQAMPIPKLGGDVAKLTGLIDRNAQSLIKTSDGFKKIGAAAQSATGIMGQFVSMMGRIAIFSVTAGLIVRGFFEITAAIKNTIAEGIQFNATMEQGRIAIAALLLQTRLIEDAQGKVLSITEAYPALLKEAAKIQKDILIANIETLGTGEDLMRVYQQVLALSGGQKGNLADVLTVSKIILNISELNNESGEKAVTNARQLFTLETMKGNTGLRFLQMSLQQAKNLSDQGLLMQEIIGRGQVFLALSEKIAGSWGGLTSTVQTFFSQIAGVAFLGTFEGLKEVMKGFVTEINKLAETGGLKAILDVDPSTLQELGASFARITVNFVKGVADITNSLIAFTAISGNLEKVVNGITAAFIGLRDVLVFMVARRLFLDLAAGYTALIALFSSSINPIGAVAVALGLLAVAFVHAREKMKELTNLPEGLATSTKKLQEGFQTILSTQGLVGLDEALQKFRATTVSIPPEIEALVSKTEAWVATQKAGGNAAAGFNKESLALLGTIKILPKPLGDVDKAAQDVAKAMEQARKSLVEQTAALVIENEELIKVAAGLISLDEAMLNAEERQNAIKTGSEETAEALRKQKEINRELRDSVDANRKAHEEFGNFLLDFNQTLQNTQEELENEVDLLEEQTDIFHSGIVSGQAFEQMLHDAAVAEKRVALEAKGVEDSAQGMAEGLVTAQENLKKTKDEAEALSKAFLTVGDIGKFFDDFIEGIVRGTQSLGNILRSAADTVVASFFKQILIGKTGFEKVLIGNLTTMFGLPSGGIVGALLAKGGLAAGQGLIGGLLQGILPDLPVLTANFGIFLNDLLSGSLSNTLTSLGGVFEGLGKALSGLIGFGLGEGFKSIFGIGGSLEAQIGGQILSSIGGIIGSLGGPVGSLIGSFFGDIIGSLFGGLFEHIPTKGTQIRKGVVQWLNDIGASFADEISSKDYFFEETKALAEQLGTDFLTASKQVLNDKAGPELARQLQALGTFVTGDMAIKLGKSLEQTGTTFGNMLIANLGLDAVPAALDEIIQKAGIDFVSVVEKLNSFFDQGKISADFYHDAILGAVELFTKDLPAGIDLAAIAMKSFTDDGIFSLELFQRNLLEIVENATLVGKSAADAITQGIEQGLSSAEIGDLFLNLVQKAMRDTAIQKFVADFMDDLFKDVDLSNLDFVGPLGELNPALEEMRKRIEEGSQALFDMLKAMGLLPGAAEEAKQGVDDLAKATEEMSAQFTSDITSGVLDGVIEALQSEGVDAALLIFKNNLLNNVYNAIVTAVLNAFLIGTIMPIIQPFIDAMALAAQQFVAGMITAEVLSEIMKGNFDSIANAMADLEPLFKELLELSKEMADEFSDMAKDVGATVPPPPVPQPVPESMPPSDTTDEFTQAIDQFNQSVDDFVNSIEGSNSDLENLIDQYNQIVKEYEALPPPPTTTTPPIPGIPTENLEQLIEDLIKLNNAIASIPQFSGMNVIPPETLDLLYAALAMLNDIGTLTIDMVNELIYELTKLAYSLSLLFDIPALAGFAMQMILIIDQIMLFLVPMQQLPMLLQQTLDVILKYEDMLTAVGIDTSQIIADINKALNELNTQGYISVDTLQALSDDITKLIDEINAAIAAGLLGPPTAGSPTGDLLLMLGLLQDAIDTILFGLGQAPSTGPDTGDAADKMNEATQAFIDEIDQLVNEFVDAGKVTSDLSQEVSDLIDEYNTLVTTLIENTDDIIAALVSLGILEADAAQQIEDWLTEVTDSFEKQMGQIIDQIYETSGAFGDIRDTMLTVLTITRDLKAALDAGTISQEQFNMFMKQVLIETIRALKNEFEDLAQQVDDMVQSIDDFIAAGSGQSDLQSELNQLNQDYQDQLKALRDEFVLLILSGEDVQQLQADLTQSYIDQAIAIGEAMKETLTGPAADTIEEFTQKMAGTFDTFSTLSSKAADLNSQLLADFAAGDYEAVVDEAEAAVTAQIALIQKLDDLRVAFSDLVDALSDDINTLIKDGMTLQEQVIFNGANIADLMVKLSQTTDFDEQLKLIDEIRQAVLDQFETQKQLFAEIRDFNIAQIEADRDDQIAAINDVKEARRTELQDSIASMNEQIQEAEKTNNRIIQLQEQISDLEIQARKEELQDSIASMNEQIQEAEKTNNRIIELQNQISDLEIQARKEGLQASINALDERIKVAQDVNNKLLQIETDKVKRQEDLAKESQENLIKMVESFRDAAKTVRQAIDQILLSDVSPLPPQKRMEEARRQFEVALGQAQGGDVEAVRGLGGLAQTFLGEASSFFASSAPFQSIFRSVVDSLNELGIQFDQAAQETELQIINNTLKDISLTGGESVEELQTLRASLERELSGLDETTGDKLNKLRKELASLQEADVGALTDIRETLQRELSGLDETTASKLDKLRTELAGLKEADVSALTDIRDVLQAELDNLDEAFQPLIDEITSTFQTKIDEQIDAYNQAVESAREDAIDRLKNLQGTAQKTVSDLWQAETDAITKLGDIETAVNNSVDAIVTAMFLPENAGVWWGDESPIARVINMPEWVTLVIAALNNIASKIGAGTVLPRPGRSGTWQPFDPSTQSWPNFSIGRAVPQNLPPTWSWSDFLGVTPVAGGPAIGPPNLPPGVSWTSLQHGGLVTEGAVPAMLHGPEVVIPLKQAKNIFEIDYGQLGEAVADALSKRGEKTPQNIHVQVVTEDGKVQEDRIIRRLAEDTESGKIMIHSRGVGRYRRGRI